ncbi:hypothetical protein [Roseomonas indoligenes]|uniref:DUF1064 domain-containing protein n=1 Tax=Roseomonas indoligenes TaxID=2820811 RepID=A0A940MX49_9PROT|nr:hypothetical protein [Pararoseomonas indoligenes]MBP0492106.1 hypothetical protein [Pararoseomonas indoligenes]
MERMSAADLLRLQAKVGTVSRMQARGRLPAGEMNKTEASYAQHLELQRIAGEVLWWSFEGIKLRLANDCHLSVDFAVLPASGVLEMRDVKGARPIITDDAKVKMKVAARAFPFVFKIVLPRSQRDGGGWEEETVAP